MYTSIITPHVRDNKKKCTAVQKTKAETLTILESSPILQGLATYSDVCYRNHHFFRETNSDASVIRVR